MPKTQTKPIITDEAIQRLYGGIELDEVGILKPRSCDHCGHTITPRKETLSRGLVDSLKEMHAVIKRKGINEFSYEGDVKWPYSRIANFQKLRYHGLAHHARNTDGSIKAGYWIITKQGGEFLRNLRGIPKTVYVEENRIIAYGDDTVFISDFYSKEIYTEDYWQTNFGLPFEIDPPQRSLF